MDRTAQHRRVVELGGLVHAGEPLLERILEPERFFRVPEYGEGDWRRRAAGLSFSWRCMQAAVDRLDLSKRIPRVEVPVCFFLGAHDLVVPSEASMEYIERLEAPAKHVEWFSDSAHFPHLEEPDRFVRQMRRYLLDAFSNASMPSRSER